MDEAERCHRLAYIAYGELITHCTLTEVIAHAQLFTWEICGKNIDKWLSEFKKYPAFEQVSSFGRYLHISGCDQEKLSQAIKTLEHPDLIFREITPTLEDVFIHLMKKKEDNFA